MGDINLKLDADQYALVSGVLKADDAVKQLLKNTTKLGTAGRRAGKQMNEGFKGFAKTAATIAAGIGIEGGIRKLGGAVIGQMKREVARLQQQQQRAAITQMNVGQMQNWAILNKPGDVSAKQLKGLVKQVSDKYDVKQTEIWPHMGGILSAKGSLAWKRVADATNQAVRLYKRSGADIGVTAGGAMDVMRLSPKATAAQALGFTMGAGQQMRVGEYEKQMRNIVPVMAAAGNYDWTAQQSTALMAYTTMMTGDFTGRKGMSGTINFMALLDKARTKGGGLIPKQVAGRRGRLKTEWTPLTQTGMAGLTELQDAYEKMTPAERTEFRARIPGEARTKGAFLSLIARDPQAVGAFESAMGGIGRPGAASAAAPWERYHKIAAAGKYEPVRGASQLFGRSIEDIDLSSPYAISSEIRKGMHDTLESLPGGSALETRIRDAMREFRGGFGQSHRMPQLAIDELRDIQAERQWSEKQIYSPGAGPYAPGMMVENPNYRPAADETVNRLIEGLEKMVEVLDARRRDDEKNNAGAPSPGAHGE